MQMQNWLNINLSLELKASQQVEFGFDLAENFALIVFFFENATNASRAFSFSLNMGMSGLNKQIKNMLAEQTSKPVCKLLIHGKTASLCEQHEGKIKSEIEQLGLTLGGSASRTDGVRGVISFASSRLRLEKAIPVENRVVPIKGTVLDRVIKVLIVDDSKTIRDLLTKILSKEPNIQVVAQAEHPFEVEKLIETHKPDVITLDIHMPDMDGVTLLSKYMPKYPVPTIMISSITKEEGPYVFRALELGAFDYIQKPSFQELPTLAPVIVEKVLQAGRSRVRRSDKAGQVSNDSKLSLTGTLDPKALIAIGSSTGGTEALKAILTRLPKEIPPVVIVQHIPPVFSKAFADRLNEICAFEVKEAEDGDLLQPSRVIIAPGGTQMQIVKRGSELRVRITDDGPVNRHKPSVDYTFDSLVKAAQDRNMIGAILTGMGADGAKGLVALRKAGARTLAQDEESCVVFGMPKEAIRLGGAEKVASLGAIPELLLTWSAGKRVAAAR